MRKRAQTVLAAAAVLTGLTLSVGATGASAATPQNVKFFWTGTGGSFQGIGIYVNGKHSGEVYWHPNGDTLEAVDVNGDGFGVYGYLGTSPVRELSTYGHKAPYRTTKGGNLPENHTYTFWACIGTDTGGLVCSDIYKVKS
jgi:hypothetical protein